ncbi:MAG: DUF1501 domain-containing protein [Planctomycetaceae bacterium]|jgi:hypothetical protein|nr:DUF1501 domain-containing protein [Planctomycetaceae bacterium]MBT6155695.1 DUF1501 domain-containing protein [Planctomycetaceae bacterium]MBT6484978.1 DUF1501 domain-containing protein [Planctomycetaceae bacterium]MBT6497536.1 DUF1501 domain-containing protein [Planctomycetaceae bacterium]
MTSHLPNSAKPQFNFQARRAFLKRAGMGCGSLALTSLLKEQGLLSDASAAETDFGSLAPKPPHFAPKAKAVIWLFMPGSPSQVDTFDYKPQLQKRDGQKLNGADPKTGFFTTSGKVLKSPFKFQQYGESGAWASEIFPHMTKHVDDMAFIYSCYSRSNNHTPAMLEMNSGVFLQGRPCVGSWVNYGLGSENANLPGFVVMHGVKPRGGNPIWSPGFLPKVFQPTAIDGRSKTPIANLARRTAMSEKQQRDQLDVLKSLNEKHQQLRPHEADLAARLESFELAYRMQTAAPEAMDIGSETDTTQKLYGIDKKETQLVARQCLTARRLVERGVRFVQLYAATNGGAGGVGDVPWDGHGDIGVNHRIAAKSVDQPIGALMADLKARGLLESTLVIWGGEFGRTSDSQGSKGRDHNPNSFTMWMAGAGIKGGVQYGASDEFGYKAVENRVGVNDLHATILKILGIDHERLTYRFNGRDYRLTDVAGNVIPEILA